MVKITDMPDYEFLHSFFNSEYLQDIEDKTVRLFEFLTTADDTKITEFVKSENINGCSDWVMLWDKDLKLFYSIELLKTKQEITISYADDYYITFLDNTLYTILDNILKSDDLE